MSIRIELVNEAATVTQPALILVYDGDTLLATIIAENRTVKGADSGLYPAVALAPIEQLTEVPVTFG